MSRRFLSALQRRDLSGIRRALFLEPLLMRNAGAELAKGPEEPDEDRGGEEKAPSDAMILPKPPPMP